MAKNPCETRSGANHPRRRGRSLVGRAKAPSAPASYFTRSAAAAAAAARLWSDAVER